MSGLHAVYSWLAGSRISWAYVLKSPTCTVRSMSATAAPARTIGTSGSTVNERSTAIVADSPGRPGVEARPATGDEPGLGGAAVLVPQPAQQVDRFGTIAGCDRLVDRCPQVADRRLVRHALTLPVVDCRPQTRNSLGRPTNAGRSGLVVTSRPQPAPCRRGARKLRLRRHSAGLVHIPHQIRTLRDGRGRAPSRIRAPRFGGSRRAAAGRDRRARAGAAPRSGRWRGGASGR